MNLAKIRKKARYGQHVTHLSELEPAEAAADAQPRKFSRWHPGRNKYLTPLEIILAGREAAGCGVDTRPIAARQMPVAAADKDEILCFRISSEIFGITIMQIKEILKPRPVTEVPRAPSFVSGVISLRGVIIPVLDMHDRLGLKRPATGGSERLIVVKTGTDTDLAGLQVDQVLQVARISSNTIEPAPPVLAGIDRDFVVGIGRVDNRIIILLNPERLADLHLSEGGPIMIDKIGGHLSAVSGAE